MQELYWRNRITLLEHKIAMNGSRSAALSSRYQPVIRKKKPPLDVTSPTATSKIVKAKPSNSGSEKDKRKNSAAKKGSNVLDTSTPSVTSTHNGKMEVPYCMLWGHRSLCPLGGALKDICMCTRRL